MRIRMLWTLVSYSPSMYATPLRLNDWGWAVFCSLEFLLGVLLFVASAPGLCDFCFNLCGGLAMRLVLYYRYGNKRQEKGCIVETKRERSFSENQSLVPAIHSCSNLRIAAHDVYIYNTSLSM